MKCRLKELINKIKGFFLNNFVWKKTLITSAVIFSTFSCVFLAGATSKRTISEACAEYFAVIAKNHSICETDKKLSGLIVEPKDGKDSKMREDTENAITELWGVFKGNNASFAPVVNANRNYDIHFEDPDYSNECLSFVYTETGLSTITYHTDSETKEPIDYKFQSSPIALMFPSARSGIQEKLPIYISQKQAERKLIAEGKSKITIEDLHSLLLRETKISINGKTFDCIIDNIYLDNFKHQYNFSNYDYYYASDVGTVIGDFVFVMFTHYGNRKDLSVLKKQSLYIMSEYPYRNKFYLEYSEEAYPPENYSFDYARHNVEDSFSLDDSYLQRALENTGSDALCIVLTVLIIFAFGSCVALIYIFNQFNQPLGLACAVCSSIFPYLVFKILFIFTGNLYVFSSYSLILYLILLAVLALSIIFINCFGRKLILENKND